MKSRTDTGLPLPLVIHLDQKNWIEMARGHYGRDPKHKPISQTVLQVSDSGKAIFPLSITHFDETVRNLNPERRKRLAKFMMAVSKGWSVIPATRIIDWEVENACLRQLAVDGYDLAKYAIKKGVSQMVGAKAELVGKNPLPSELNKKLLDKIESPETLLFLMEHGITRSQLRKQQKNGRMNSERFEQLRLSHARVRDNDLRHRAELAGYFLSDIAPKIISFLLAIGVNPSVFADEAFGEKGDKEKIIRFFQSIPTAYCLFELTFYRDMQRNRRVEPNDLNDIMSLSVALPYCDVVLTETMWRAAIIYAKLDKLRPTRVLTTAGELAPVLAPL